MIKTLHGIRETVDFADGSSIVVYENEEYEDYPNHWHPPLEIIMPITGGYRVVCGGVPFDLNAGDILLIAPGTLHSLYAPKTGRRLIVQVDFSFLSQLKEFNSVMSFMAPGICISAQGTSEIHAEAERILYRALDEYRSKGPRARGKDDKAPGLYRQVPLCVRLHQSTFR